MNNLSPEKAFIFRTTHIDNLPWILANGVHCQNSGKGDPDFREIGNRDLIAKRKLRDVPIAPGGTLGDYIPFYFTPYSPMLLNIKTGHNGMQQTPMSEIVILVSSLHRVAELRLPFVFTDRHAYLKAARYTSDLTNLTWIDWAILQNRDFRRDPDDPAKVERYQAEALVYKDFPVSALLGIVCYDAQIENHINGRLANAGVSLKVVVRQDWYF